MLDVWKGSEYASGLGDFFYRVSKRDAQERLIYGILIAVFTPNLEFSPYSEVMHWSATFKLTKGWSRLTLSLRKTLIYVFRTILVLGIFFTFSSYF